MRFHISLFCMLITAGLSAQTRTIGLKKITWGHHPGYYLFTPLASKKTYLINNCGELVKSWQSAYTAGATQLLGPDGSLYRCGLYPPPFFGPGSGGIIEKFDWQGNITWTFKLSDTNFCLHHDIKLMPNGNILAIAWESHTAADARAEGRNPSVPGIRTWSEAIFEIQPLPDDSFNIVWEWHAWDHIIQDYDSTKPNYGVVKDHPELFNINYIGESALDWFHLNSIDYNADLDQIALSAHTLDELYILDHSTSTTQAKGHSGGTYGKGGDILYRWGNPQAYDRGEDEDRQLFKQHHVHWIPKGFAHAGKLLMFNNGFNRADTKFSSIDLIDPPTSAPGVYTINSGKPYGPDTAMVIYRAPNPSDFYAANLSAVHSLPDSSFFITSGPQGRFFEIDARDSITWEYVNPIVGTGSLSQGTTPILPQNNVFRCIYYPENFSGFTGKNLVSDTALEKNPYSPTLCELASLHPEKSRQNHVIIYPNPATDHLNISGMSCDKISVYSVAGNLLLQAESTQILDISDLPAGMYFVTTENSTAKIRSSFIKE